MSNQESYAQKLSEREGSEYALPPNIVLYPDPHLRIVAKEVTAPESMREAAEMMIQTMASAQGVGIAAQQVGLDERIIIVAPSEDRIIVALNPQIVSFSGGVKGEEGCLSIPGFRADVARAEAIVVRWTDLDNVTHQEAVGDFEAIIWQHEIDHLDGILFPDRIGPLKRRDFLARFGLEKHSFKKPRSLYSAHAETM